MSGTFPPDYIENNNASDTNKRLLYILLISLSVRILVPLIVVLTSGDYRLFYSPDTFTYLRPAEELLLNGRFYSNGVPEIFRTPGYPVFLIPGILVGHVEIVTIVMQIALSCMTAYFVFKISLLLFKNTRVALISAFLCAIEPVSALYASKLLSETLFAFLSTLSVYCLIQYFRTNSIGTLLFSSALISFSTYVRPAGYFFPFVVLAVLLFRSFRKKKIILLTHAFGFLLCSLLIIGLWHIRNIKEAGFSGFSSVADYNLYCYQAASVLAINDNVPYYQEHHDLGCGDMKVYFLNHPEQSNWDRGRIYRFMGKEGMRIILREPLTYLLIHIEGMIRTLIDPGITEYLIMFKQYSWSGGLLGQILDRGLFATLTDFAGTMPVFFFMILIALGLYLVISLVSTVIALSHEDFPFSASTAVILCLLAYDLLVSGGPVGYHRFRLPMMPMISVFSAYGLYLTSQKWRRRKTDGPSR